MTPEQAGYIDNLSSGNIKVARRGQLVVNPYVASDETMELYGVMLPPRGLELSMISVAAIDVVDFYLKNCG